MNRRTLLLGGASLAAIGAIAFTTGGEGGNLLVGMANAQDADPSAIQDMVMGDADAPIEMIEYASFTCPHCANFHATVWPQLKADYIDTGKVRFIYREVYFDRPGLWASMMARCGGEMRFFGVTAEFYDKQRMWTASGDPATIAADLRTVAKTAGLTDEMLDACMQDAENAQNLVAWYEQNAAADNVRSTPSFIIDGEAYSNMSYDDMKAILDAKLEG
ncbi:thiol-disulfide oxidoreductase [Loktanella sp. 3ANDIMAR09]|uniref:DsbA family protein n=1 Tax=Loktanella gaetbuli TaxID=2881335 RepID=A0ABS8BTK3_9RHOB|nr:MULTISPECIES: DsbA family protein [Loktanella]KQI70202.1 thiol-disulfide oxidoreductase [Loktanella sp. 3ANDIMAR09]MCB5199075.1 DsbA family protein [Loktanella gaetbuli]